MVKDRDDLLRAAIIVEDEHGRNVEVVHVCEHSPTLAEVHIPIALIADDLDVPYGVWKLKFGFGELMKP